MPRGVPLRLTKLAVATLSIQLDVNTLASGREAMASSVGVKLTVRVIIRFQSYSNAAVRRGRLSEMDTGLAVTT